MGGKGLTRTPEQRARMAAARAAVGNEALRGRKRPADVVVRAAQARAAVGYAPVAGRVLPPRTAAHREAISRGMVSSEHPSLKPAARRVPAREGDTKQARWRVSALVMRGLLPHPKSVPCVDCGWQWRQGDPPHEYDHHHGYGADHHECVEAVCKPCHLVREALRLRMAREVLA